MANSDCKNILNLIPLYIDNMLSEEETDIVGRHIASCENCRKEFEFMSSVMTTAASLEEINVSADFHKKLMEKAAHMNKTKRAKRIVLLRRSASGVAAAAVVALCVVSFSNLNRTDTQDIPSVNTPVPEEKVLLSPGVDTPADTNTSTPAHTDETPVKTAPKKTADTPNTTPVPNEVTVKEATTIYTFSGDAPNSGGGSSAAPQAVTAEEIPAEVMTILDEQTNTTAVEISLSDENRDAVLEILAPYEKDDIGYIVPDIGTILQELSDMGIEAKTTTDISYSQNYIIIK